MDWTKWVKEQPSSSDDEAAHNTRGDDRDGGKDWTSTPVPTTTASRAEPTSGTVTSNKRSSLLMMAGIAAVAAVGTGSVVYLVSGGGNTSTAEVVAESSPAIAPETQGPSPVSSSASTTVAVSGDCEAEDGEQKITGSTDSLQGAAAQFQENYYSGMTEDMDPLLTESSSMHGQNWGEVLASVEGSSHCLTMQPPEGDTVSVELVVETGEETATFEQVVEGVEDESGAWKIQEIRGV